MFYRKPLDHAEAETVVHRRRLNVDVLRWMLLALFLVCAWKAYRGPTPWHRSVVERLEDHDKLTLKSWINMDKEHPGALRAKEHATVGWWYAAVGGAGIAVLLLVSLPLWAPMGELEGDPVHDAPQADEENVGDTGFAKLVSGRPIFLLLVGFAVIIGGWLRAPGLSHSLWNDEELAMRKYVVGDYKTQTDGRREFQPATWVDTLAENGNSNNHVLQSVLSRASLSVWRFFTDKEPHQFSELWLRLPSYFAALGAIWVIGLIGWEFGNRWCGVTAAWLLTLHPWHVRYATEARGYSLMLFFLALLILGLIRAQRGHVMWAWLMFAIGEAGMLASNAGSIYIAIAVNVMAVVEMAIRGQPKRIGALLAMNLLAAVPVMFLMLPSVPQVVAFIANDTTVRLPANADWLRDLGSHVLAGVQYANPMTTEHAGTSWQTMAAASPTLMMPLAGFLGLLVLLGCLSAFFESAASRFSIIAIIAAGGLGFWHAKTAHHPNLSWYYIYLTFPLCLALGLAVVRLQIAPAVLSIVMIGCFGYATELPRQTLIEVDRQPIRQTVQAIRDIRPHALTGVFGVSDKQAESYDPNVWVLENAAQLEQLLARGETDHTAVFVYFAGDRDSSTRNPELHKRVTQSADFTLWKQFKGTEAMFSYRIYRCTALPY